MSREVQLLRDNYDIKNNPKVREKYPALYREISEHDSLVSSSWYSLSEQAYEEHGRYVKDDSIGYVTNTYELLQKEAGI